jgi:hypothetical protein
MTHSNTTRLIQIKKGNVRRVALVEEPVVRLLDCCSSIYELAHVAIRSGLKLSDVARQRARRETLDYEPIYRGESEWKLLPAIDHPEEPARCLISGTGLTHLGSARNRQSMHASKDEDLTDSMKMFRWGVEGGRPAAGQIGTSPEWFYKGDGRQLRAHGEPIEVPCYAEDGGEEAEIAGIYVIGPNGQPYRVGLAAGNEFSDHQFEKKNYLYLAGSKLRMCAIGPELVLDPDFKSISVAAAIVRDGKVLWSKTFPSGDSEMCHSLENIEHHHFKYHEHRRAGDVHVHFFGTDGLSFSDNIRLTDGDVMQISAEGYGRPLRNSVRIEKTTPEPVSVIPLQ